MTAFPGVCPVADRLEWLPPRNVGGQMTSTRGLVFHVNAGNGDPYGWWTQPTTPIASSHFQLMKDGTLIQYVPCDVVAWCQVDGSSTWHSIETEGWPDEPLTDAALEKFARLYAWGSQACGWPMRVADAVDGAGLGWHGMGGYAWGGHFGCPGDARKAQRPAILARAGQLTDAGKDPFAMMPTIDTHRPLNMAHPYIRIATALLAANGAWIAVTPKMNTRHDIFVTAIRWFQEQRGLTVTENVDGPTWSALAHPKGV